MKVRGRSEPVVGEMTWDDLWLGVICQSNPEIAGSPRDIFRYSLPVTFCGIELLDGPESLWRSGSTKLQIRKNTYGGVSPTRISERGREGNIPDSRLRFLNDY